MHAGMQDLRRAFGCLSCGHKKRRSLFQEIKFKTSGLIFNQITKKNLFFFLSNIFFIQSWQRLSITVHTNQGHKCYLSSTK